MTRNLIEIITGYVKGVIAFFVYVPFVGIVFSYTYHLYSLLKYVRCSEAPCILRSVVYWITLVIHDTIIALPIFFVFGAAFGLFIKKYHISRPLILSAGFFSGQFIYHMIYSELGYLPYYVELAHAIPIILLFIVFTRMGQSAKLRRQSQKKMGLAQQAGSQGISG